MDALIGLGLRQEPESVTAELIQLCNEEGKRVISLDVPSGLDATTGEMTGVSISPERILTLALPKTGLHLASAQLYLADIGIPPEVFRTIGRAYDSPFEQQGWLELIDEPLPDAHSRECPAGL